MKKHYIYWILFGAFLIMGLGERNHWPTNTIFVDSAGKEGVNTIAKAVELSANGDVIRIYPGTYAADKITVSKDISFLGMGASMYDVIITDDDSLFIITGTDIVALANLTLRTTGSGTAVQIDTCNLLLRDCRVLAEAFLIGTGIVTANDCQFDISTQTGMENGGTLIANRSNWGYREDIGYGTTYYGLYSGRGKVYLNYCGVYSDSATVICDEGNVDLFASTAYSVAGDSSVIMSGTGKLGLIFSNVSGGYTHATKGAVVEVFEDANINARLSIIDNRNSGPSPGLALRTRTTNNPVLYTGIYHGDMWFDTTSVAGEAEGLIYIHGVLATTATTVSDSLDLIRMKQYNRDADPLIGETIYSYGWTKRDTSVASLLVPAFAIMDRFQPDTLGVGIGWFGDSDHDADTVHVADIPSNP